MKTISLVLSETDFVAHDGQTFYNANITALVAKCSGFAVYKSFVIVMCMYNTQENYLRVFELPQFTWFDVKYKSTSGRVFDTLNMKAEVTGNYLSFKNFNPIYNRYHTCVILRALNPDDDNEKKIDPSTNIIFSNTFRPSFRLINILEESMNDEHFDI